MAGGMTLADLVEDLKRSLHDAAGVFNAADDGDWKRFLATAATAMEAKRPRTLLGTVVLQAEVDVYPLALPDFAGYKTHLWATRQVRPWSPCYPGATPRVSLQGSADAWTLVFDPAPSAQHLSAFGSSFRFWYFAKHQVTADGASLALADRPLLLLRAQAEAMRELTMRNINKPIGVRDGFTGQPRNSTPAALYAALLTEWKDAA